MRASLATALGAAAGVTVAALIGSGLYFRHEDAVVGTASPPADHRAVERPRLLPAPVESPSVATVPEPTSMDRRLSGAPRAIYRCRSGGKTTYSNEPCRGAAVVNESSAVEGFDSKPSVRMEQLVERGRAPDVADAASPRQTASVPVAESTNCLLMRRQIIDIDRFLREPNDIRTLDYWRQVRQDVRTSMAREHC